MNDFLAKLRQLDVKVDAYITKRPVTRTIGTQTSSPLKIVIRRHPQQMRMVDGQPQIVQQQAPPQQQQVIQDEVWIFPAYDMVQGLVQYCYIWENYLKERQGRATFFKAKSLRFDSTDNTAELFGDEDLFIDRGQFAYPLMFFKSEFCGMRKPGHVVVPKTMIDWMAENEYNIHYLNMSTDYRGLRRKVPMYSGYVTYAKPHPRWVREEVVMKKRKIEVIVMDEDGEPEVEEVEKEEKVTIVEL